MRGEERKKGDETGGNWKARNEEGRGGNAGSKVSDEGDGRKAGNEEGGRKVGKKGCEWNTMVNEMEESEKERKLKKLYKEWIKIFLNEYEKYRMWK